MATTRAGLLLLALLLAPTTAYADTSHAAPRAPAKPRRIEWKASWSRFGVGNAVTAGLFAGVGAAMTRVPPIESHRRSGGVAFDDAVRDRLGVDGSARTVARAASDVILGGLMLAPYVLDSAWLTWRVHKSPDAAWQMAALNFEVMAISLGVQGVTNVLVARERPFGRDCETLEGECGKPVRYRSFFSGHATHAFTAASLLCYHHMTLRLLGSGPGDAIACASALALAGSVATLRVVGEMHYASDVIVGAGVGTLIGLGVPFLHQHGGFPTLELADRRRERRVAIAPQGLGLGLMGQF